jgi:hypothetical protein
VQPTRQSSRAADAWRYYPDDPRGHSHLLLGFTEQDEPIHMVGAIHEGTLVIITIYRPDPELWENLRVRREKK